MRTDATTIHGNTMNWPLLESLPDALAPFTKAVLSRPDAAERLAEMALTLRSRISPEDAVVLAAYARALAPDDPWVWRLTSGILSARIPQWHWAIARDTRRNAVYDQAIRAAITPESVVLEVGTGSGILAMMAARAGAKHVYTIEIVPAIAAAARQNIEQNGLSDRITVITADALAVTVGDALPECCNVFLHEIVSNDLLAENVLPIVRHARKALLTEDAVHLPDAVWMTCQIAAGAIRERARPLGMQSGFDLSATDVLRPATVGHGGPLKGYGLLSEPCDVLRFDLTGRPPEPAADVRHALRITRAGEASVILQWIGLSFPDGTVYANPPDSRSCWDVRMQDFRPRAVRAGQDMSLRVRYNDGIALAFIDDAAEAGAASF